MKRILAICGIFTVMLLIPLQALNAQDPLNQICSGRGANSAACQSRSTQNPLVGPTGILTRVIQIIVMITAIASVIMIMVGGLKYILSSGDPNNVNSAKNTILYAIVGLLVAVLAQSIVTFVLRRL